MAFGPKREVIEDGEKKVKQYKNTYANSVFRTLKVMMTEAVRRGLIAENPCLNVQRLKNDRKGIEIITAEEVRRLFPKNYQTVWGGREIAYVANKLASLTGMRAGEILGLRGEFVFDNYILVCGQYGPFGYLPHTKTKENRNIPVMPEMMSLLRKLIERNGKGFVFSLDGGASPVSRNNLYTGLQSALEKIGIDDKEMRRRGLTLHSWRHFVNTELQRLGLTIPQVQSVTGHKSDRMTEWYSHPDARQLDAVIEAQAVIAGTDQLKGSKSGGDTIPAVQGNYSGLKIVKMPDRIADTTQKGA
jgi:integrase